MKLERAAVNAGKQVPAKTRNQNRERAKAAREERNQEGTPMLESYLPQAAIAVPKSLVRLFHTLLKAYERHDIDRFCDRAKHNDGGQDCQRDGGRDDNGASPTAEKSKDHEGGQTRGNKCFPDNSTDRATNKNRLIRQRCYIELRRNRGLNLRQKRLDAGDYIQGRRIARPLDG